MQTLDMHHTINFLSDPRLDLTNPAERFQNCDVEAHSLLFTVSFFSREVCNVGGVCNPDPFNAGLSIKKDGELIGHIKADSTFTHEIYFESTQRYRTEEVASAYCPAGLDPKRIPRYRHKDGTVADAFFPQFVTLRFPAQLPQLHTSIHRPRPRHTQSPHNLDRRPHPH